MEFTVKTSGFKADSNTCECSEGEQPCACEDDDDGGHPSESEPMDKITKMISKPPKKETKEEVQTKAVK